MDFSWNGGDKRRILMMKKTTKEEPQVPLKSKSDVH